LKRLCRLTDASFYRYLRKQRKNVIDPTAVAIREKLEKQKSERQKERAAALQPASEKKYSALDRFKRPG
jgi:U3 small nucleolar RNA-associated protein 7